MVSRETVLAVAAGALFGAGLTLSGMTDPAKVRAFLDVTGAWNPALAFVLVGALLPMVLAWRVAGRLERPLVGERFDLPQTQRLDGRLLLGAAVFGVGWGLAGLCPGPAFAALVLRPGPAALFLAAMLAGMALHAAALRSPRVPGRTSEVIG